MYPPIFPAVNASSACRALLKSGPAELRFYQFGLAPQGVAKPYAVWRRVYGEPANYLGNIPDMDSLTIQVDVYANTADSARSVAIAIRDAIQYPHSDITNWLAEDIDPDTKNNHIGFQSDWFVERV